MERFVANSQGEKSPHLAIGHIQGALNVLRESNSDHQARVDALEFLMNVAVGQGRSADGKPETPSPEGQTAIDGLCDLMSAGPAKVRDMVATEVDRVALWAGRHTAAQAFDLPQQLAEAHHRYRATARTSFAATPPASGASNPPVAETPIRTRSVQAMTPAGAASQKTPQNPPAAPAGSGLGSPPDLEWVDDEPDGPPPLSGRADGKSWSIVFTPQEARPAEESAIQPERHLPEGKHGSGAKAAKPPAMLPESTAHEPASALAHPLSLSSSSSRPVAAATVSGGGVQTAAKLGEGGRVDLTGKAAPEIQLTDVQNFQVAITAQREKLQAELSALQQQSSDNGDGAASAARRKEIERHHKKLGSAERAAWEMRKQLENPSTASSRSYAVSSSLSVGSDPDGDEDEQLDSQTVRLHAPRNLASRVSSIGFSPATHSAASSASTQASTPIAKQPASAGAAPSARAQLKEAG